MMWPVGPQCRVGRSNLPKIHTPRGGGDLGWRVSPCGCYKQFSHPQETRAKRNGAFKSAAGQQLVMNASFGYWVSTYELGHEGNHEIEETNGLDEGETKNGVREELATEGRVAGNGVEEGGEDETDTDTGTSQTDGGRTHTEVLGDLDHGLGDLRRVGAAGADLGEGLAGGRVDDRGGLLALEAVEACGRSSRELVVRVPAKPSLLQLAKLAASCPELVRQLGEPLAKLEAQCCSVAKVRDSLPDMARFEVTEANWVRAAGLATLGAAEATSLEAKRADILMVWFW